MNGSLEEIKLESRGEENKRVVTKVATTVVSLVAASFSSNSAFADRAQLNEVPQTTPSTVTKIVNENTNTVPSLPTQTEAIVVNDNDKTLEQSNVKDTVVPATEASISPSYTGRLADALQDFYNKYSDTIKSILAALGTFSLGYLAKGWRKGQIQHGNLLNQSTTMPCQFNFIAKENDCYAPCIRNFATTKTIEQIFGVEAGAFLREAKNTDIKLPLIVISDIKSQSGKNTQKRWLNLIADEAMNPCDQAFKQLDCNLEKLMSKSPDIYKKDSKINDLYIFLTCEDGKNTTKDFPTKPRIFVLTKDEIEFYATRKFLKHSAVECGNPSHIYRVNALHNICRAFVKGLPQDMISNKDLIQEIDDIRTSKDVPALVEGIHYVKRTRGVGDVKLERIDQAALQILRKTGKLKAK